MSDEDERMDRARRIRQMREGRRSADPAEESTADTDDDSSAAEAPSADDHSETTDQSVAAQDRDATTADPADSDTESDSVPAETASDPVTQDAAAAPDGSSSDPEEPTEPTADPDEIDGPAGDDEWFDDSPAESLQADSTAVSGGADAGESPDPGTEAAADPEVSETAAAAASAAAAFEVDESDQAQSTPEPTTADPEPTPEEPEAEIRVLEFRLGDEHYCLDIEHVEEIVKEESVTRVPNTPEHVHGVVDLRGQITTILDPKIALDIDDDDGEQLIVVFGAETFEDQGHAGWIVDEVRQVLPITESEVKESPLNRQSIKGVIERDEEFVIWTTPEVALEDAED